MCNCICYNCSWPQPEEKNVASSVIADYMYVPIRLQVIVIFGTKLTFVTVVVIVPKRQWHYHASN